MGDYPGKKIVIGYDEHVCTHSGNCVKNLPAVFDVNRKPWIDADGATVEAIKATISLCPSGALSYKEIS
jgi:uncharacterized Fe-S cluster protein YjdI